MPLSGDGPGRMRELIRGFQEIATPRFARQMNQSLGAEALALVKSGFDLSMDPYGKAWAPVLRGGLPLRKTGRLRNAFTYRGDATKMELENGLIYANMMNFGTAGLPGGKLTPTGKKALAFTLTSGRTHRKGSSNLLKHMAKDRSSVVVRSVVIPGRKMVPDEGDLPPLWESKLRATADKVMELIMKAKGG